MIDRISWTGVELISAQRRENQLVFGCPVHFCESCKRDFSLCGPERQGFAWIEGHVFSFKVCESCASAMADHPRYSYAAERLGKRIGRELPFAKKTCAELRKLRSGTPGAAP